MNDRSEFDHFVRAQAPVYGRVLQELAAGRKRTHWMWFIFPQIRGLGNSATAERFALDSLPQAERYLRHELLGQRLVECTRRILALPDPDPKAIFGDPDWMKFRSSMTLFAQCDDSPALFAEAIDRCFAGVEDNKTLDLLDAKSARERTLDTLTKIGVGRTAEIFAWSEGKALRLFRSGASLPYALREMNAFRSAYELGLPAPAVYPADGSKDGIVRIGGRLGFVIDRVDGPSMLEMLSRRPWLVVRYAKRLAALHAEMHSRSASSLPSQRQRFEIIIEHLEDDLGKDVTKRIRRALDELPDETSVCHGDFHPDNVLLSPSGPVIVDWGPTSAGHRAADLAWTEYLFRHAGYPPSMRRGWQRGLIFLLRRVFHFVYRRTYARIASFDWGEVRAWAPVIAAIRLGDGIPE